MTAAYGEADHSTGPDGSMRWAVCAGPARCAFGLF
ncbi:hypothetical protein ThrDRAFT_02445 [Frankia casuarinae]|nr:hypothetical protein CcI6DRAFT_03029 [Frankia sp. CcI6]EYT91926.1 hypothetical protein ThrDRAFT_02445 [Frankia casuarinae]KDA42647.1 hypothetical protein BMG523Draft_02487 [Frankia sp. BMG5.23]OAA22954.1 hypothetical protein AAY23_105826 [Frankia casuarinae]